MKYTVIGTQGFLGSAITKRLGGASSYPTAETKVLFYMASKTHVDFEKNVDYHMTRAVQDFLYLLPYCRDHGIYFVYASSALVYEKDIAFTRCKTIMEKLAANYPNTLGLRIFPVYGPGEHATVFHQWIADIKSDKQPTVYGDGNQVRDFIFVDDVVDQILSLVEQKRNGIVDIGAGKPASFNSIIETINKVLGKDIKPLYVDKPEGYSEGIYCKDPLPTKIDIEMGIRAILEQKA